jgi:hypothetical protein
MTVISSPSKKGSAAMFKVVGAFVMLFSAYAGNVVAKTQLEARSSVYGAHEWTLPVSSEHFRSICEEIGYLVGQVTKADSVDLPAGLRALVDQLDGIDSDAPSLVL